MKPQQILPVYTNHRPRFFLYSLVTILDHVFRMGSHRFSMFSKEVIPHCLQQCLTWLAEKSTTDSGFSSKKPPFLGAMFDQQRVPSGKLLHNYGQSPFFMGKSHYFNGHGFNSYVTNYQRVPHFFHIQFSPEKIGALQRRPSSPSVSLT